MIFFSKYFFSLNYFSVIIVFFFPLKFILVMVKLDKPESMAKKYSNIVLRRDTEFGVGKNTDKRNMGKT